MSYPFRNTKLPLAERVKDLVSRLTLDEKLHMLTTFQHGVKRLGIGDWHVGAEVARGYVSRKPETPTTVFPQPIGMAGMFDTELMEKLGEIAGVEARILHSKDPVTHLMLWGPTVDACRDPRWGRNEEGYGEDPFLTGQMTIAYTKGMAGDDPVYKRTIPTLKHFFANNNEEKRMSCDANIEPRTKYEYYYEFFRYPIQEGGACSMMASYNSISGVPALMNPELNTVVKDEWGLDFVVTDAADLIQTVDAHHYCDTHAESMALALKAGTDVMTDDEEAVIVGTREALARGLMTEEDIDRALFNSLSARFMLGEFDPPEMNPYANPDPALMDCQAHREINHLAALEQFVLLENDGLLPLKKGIKIAVLGDIGDKNYMDWYTGYSSYNVSVIDGLKAKFGEKNVVFDDCHDHVAIRSKANGKLLCADKEGYLHASADKPDDRSTFIKADWGGEVTYKVKAIDKFFTTDTMRADSDTTYRWFNREILRPKVCGDGIKYITYFKDSVLGIDDDGRLTTLELKGVTDKKLFTEEIVSDGLERAKKLAKDADVVIVCVGNDPLIIARECFDRTTLSLPEHQSGIVSAAAGVNKNVLLSVISSYPYAICKERELVRAAIYTSHAGPELGNAFAEVVSGEYAPAGRLAQTWYTSEEELPAITDYDIIKNDTTYLYYKGKPLYPFGYGKSYAEFSYSGLSADRQGEETVVSFDITNTSDVDGEEVPQVYFRAEAPRVKRPLKQLCGFRRVKVGAGQTVRVTIPVEDRYLRFYDVTREKFCVENGVYEFMVGASCEDIKLHTSVKIRGEKIPSRDMGLSTKAINYDDKYGTKMKFAQNLDRHYMSGGGLIFRDAKLSGEKSVQICYATSGVKGKLMVFCGDEQICEQTLPGTVCETAFTQVTVPIKSRRGVHDLRLHMENMSLLEFKMI
ncbi:MAG: glycoside hydrolase family 3 C-terminal domain-containing protein [Oscillospiraceae bacterium]|nr:glycoside hydrolase family 3 C-terminal domain-containing protein [Oscillospiraceae bacterium]